MSKFKTIWSLIIGTIGALLIVRTVLSQTQSLPPYVLLIIGLGMALFSEFIVKKIPEFGRFNNEVQDSIVGMLSGLFIGYSLWQYVEEFALANITLSIIIGISIMMFKEQIPDILGGIFNL